MEAPKIHLSDTELDLVQNAEIILTKNTVLQKMKMLLEEVQDQQVQYVHLNTLESNPLFLVSPKISRGENYLGLPWLILDYPRISNPGGMFFIRTMFWWGRFFSSTIHVSGKYKEVAGHKIALSKNKIEDFFIGVNDDPWIHHFDDNNYKAVNTITDSTFQESCAKPGHLKIAKQFPLNQWKQASALLIENWKILLKVSGSVT